MGKRSSKWTFIAYPDSAPKNWQEIIKSTHIKVAISPLHDKDLNPTGDEKKAHWHIFLEYESLKSLDQVKEITESVNGTIPQIVNSPVGMIRYFIHKDNPEKFQYNWNEIVVYNGFDLSKYDTYTESELDEIFQEITVFIEDNNIMEYSDLVMALKENEYYRIVRKNTIFFNTFITSRRNKYKEWMKTQNIQQNKQKKK